MKSKFPQAGHVGGLQNEFLTVTPEPRVAVTCRLKMWSEECAGFESIGGGDLVSCERMPRPLLR